MGGKKADIVSRIIMVAMGISLAGIAVFLLEGKISGIWQEAPDGLAVYEQRINKEAGYAYLTHEGRIYVPYCAYDPKYLGECIGYCDVSGDEYTGAGEVYVYSMKGCHTEEWVIELLKENCLEGMILREINVTEIPSGLSSEYIWNK